MVLFHIPVKFYLLYHVNVFLFVLSPYIIPDVSPLVCNKCVFLDKRDRCLSVANDAAETCDDTTTTCVTAVGLRKDTTFSPSRNTPAMGRHCSLNPTNDADIFGRLPKGQEFICFNITRDDSLGKGPDGKNYVDRRCLCAKDRCNIKMWDEIYLQPTLLENFTANDKPVIPTGLGSNSLASISAWTNYTVIGLPTGNGSNPDGSGGASTGATTAASGNETADGGNSTSGTDSRSKSAEDGSNTGLIIGIAVGVLILATAVGGGLWYWFKVRKRKASSASSGASDNTAGTEVSDDNE
ncbi:uncharacterized protein LOC129600816 [Paramacrobiotus metropolitanus]|uniref:uncharacterized protein LOC129600816 n=1 Tax=Paramacrobiotus metropolitanus TaxID=2943436 RepID=UPI002446591F|nr:uncharacterized protein LOC129600816 [Paramacrobiotus metropolitanus]